MDNAILIRSLMYAIDVGDMDKVSTLLTEDFCAISPNLKKIGKKQWIKTQSLMKDAFPDGSFNLYKIDDKGKTATIYYQVTGTHRRDLDLSSMGMAKIPATFKFIKLPREHADCTIKNGKIASMTFYPAKNGGIPGILAQLKASD